MCVCVWWGGGGRGVNGNTYKIVKKITTQKWGGWVMRKYHPIHHQKRLNVDDCSKQNDNNIISNLNYILLVFSFV